MARDKIEKMLQRKDPNALRTQVKAVDILHAATEREEVPQKEERKSDETIVSDTPIHKDDEEDRIVKKSQKLDRKERTEKQPQKSKRQTGGRKPHIYSEQAVRSVLAVEKRETVRYSFEIYIDQKEDIERICEMYEEAVEKKLSASRLIREVLDSFIPDALKTFEKSE
jgi:hypothetical protein